MHTTLLLAAMAAAQPNLDLASGKLTGWDGDGFAITTFGGPVASSAGARGKAVLHRTFILPSTATHISFRAALFRPAGAGPGEMLDVVLEAANREFAPRQLLTADGWIDAPRLLPPDGRRLREYRFDVAKLAGRRVRVALIDSDERPGCHVLAGGFAVATRDDRNSQEFAADMVKLQKTHGLAKMMRYETRHFLALSNAPAADSEYRLQSCEAIYAAFFDHFRKRGFETAPPAEKMLVAIFNTQAGYEALLGGSFGDGNTGVYNRLTNRLAVYDVGTNRSFVKGKRNLDSTAKKGASDLERERRAVAFGRLARDYRDDTNLNTVMHEVAHQLSFNGGLLSRTGDVPLWLAEGLAVYCESSRRGVWQGIGEPNPTRAETLARQLRAKSAFIPLLSLVRGDEWARPPQFEGAVVLGYSQSWALFRLLIEERPKQLKAYLRAIADRKTPDRRLADFSEAFGDVAKLDRRYQAYLRETARKEAASAAK